MGTRHPLRGTCVCGCEERAPELVERSRGQAIVEFAIIAPVLLLLAIGGAEMGMGLLHAQVAQGAAQTIADDPSAEADELARLSMDCASSITEADGIRLVALDCDNPWPLAAGYVAPVISVEASAAIDYSDPTTECTVPDLVGMPVAAAWDAWLAQGFTSPLSFLPGTGGTVGAQSEAAFVSVPCTTAMRAST